MQGMAFLIPIVGIACACVALGVSRASYYRSRAPKKPRRPRPRPARALSDDERTEVLQLLDSDEHADKAPAQVYAALLDKGEYVCSPRTMYRVLADDNQVCERRAQRRHPQRQKPQLVATAPNQVWSWDITKLAGPVKGIYYSLYVVLDIFSRFVVGWLLAEREAAELAQQLIEDCYRREGVAPGQLAVHADHGSPMIAKSTAQLYIDLGIAKSHSRPRVSDDNPFSEAHFKTVKYRPEMPDRFGSPQHARQVLSELLRWYCHEHYHSDLAMLTPADVHYGRAADIIAERQRVLDAAHQRHPERFVNGRPTHKTPNPAVWINPPTSSIELNKEVAHPEAH